MGMGAVCHTLNPRLFAEQLCYIINHAEDRIIFTDLTFAADRWREPRADCRRVKHIVVMTDERSMKGVDLPGALCFETWSRRLAPTSSGAASTRTPPPASATPRARPAIRRACSTRTARTSSTR
jgi:long-subunit acyl-CoA synthetase (AMP-forming)